MTSAVRQSREASQLPAIDKATMPAPYQSPAPPVSSKLDIFQNQLTSAGPTLSTTLLSRTRSSQGRPRETMTRKPAATRLYQKMESSFQASQQAAEEERRLHLARKHKISQYQRPAQARLVRIDYHRQAPARSGLDGYLEKQYGLEDITAINGRGYSQYNKITRGYRGADPYSKMDHFDRKQALIPTNGSSSPARQITKSDSSQSVNSLQTRVRQEHKFNRK